MTRLHVAQASYFLYSFISGSAGTNLKVKGTGKNKWALTFSWKHIYDEGLQDRGGPNFCCEAKLSSIVGVTCTCRVVIDSID